MTVLTLPIQVTIPTIDVTRDQALALCSPLQRARLAREWSAPVVVAGLRAVAARRGFGELPGDASLRRMLSHWENGHRVPEEFYRCLFCELYDASADELGFAPEEATPLYQARLDRYWSLADVADRVEALARERGVRIPPRLRLLDMLKLWEQGGSSPSQKIGPLLADVYGVPAFDLGFGLLADYVRRSVARGGMVLDAAVLDS